jgi:hypothetical protein
MRNTVGIGFRWKPIALILGCHEVRAAIRGHRRWPGRPVRTASGVLMIRIFLFVVAAGLVLMTIGVVMLGTFPPTPQPHAVEKVIPNDKFSTH